MTKTGKILATIGIFIVGSLLLGFSREVAPGAGWVRILIGVGAFAVLMWLWGDKSQKGKG